MLSRLFDELNRVWSKSCWRQLVGQATWFFLRVRLANTRSVSIVPGSECFPWHSRHQGSPLDDTTACRRSKVAGISHYQHVPKVFWEKRCTNQRRRIQVRVHAPPRNGWWVQLQNSPSRCKIPLWQFTPNILTKIAWHLLASKRPHHQLEEWWSRSGMSLLLSQVLGILSPLFIDRKSRHSNPWKDIMRLE